MTTTADQPVDHLAPRWPRLVVVRALLPLGILGALALSAAATIDMAARNHVPDGTLPGTLDVQPAAVGMVEIVSIAGTLLAIFGTRKGTRVRGMVAVAGLGFVQLVAGAKAYGWFGLIAPIAAVYLVHLAAEAWAELRADALAAVVELGDGPVELDEDVADQPADESGELVIDPATGEPQVFDVDEVGGELEARPTATLDLADHGPLTLVDTLRARSTLPSERALVAEMRDEGDASFTRHRAKLVLLEARHGLREVSA